MRSKMPQLSAACTLIVILAGCAKPVGTAGQTGASAPVPTAKPTGASDIARVVAMQPVAVAIGQPLPPPPEPRPRQPRPAKESVLVLTGANRADYVALSQGRYTKVLMANGDVTDADVAAIVFSDDLREVDLNRTQITDKTIALLASMKTLEVVRVADTNATTSGIEKLLAGLPYLAELDARGLGVPSKVLRNWRAEDPSSRKFAN